MVLKRVMVVEDEALIRELVARILRQAGYEVVGCGSGNVCLALLEAGFQGVILMDIKMPDMDGWETIATMAHLGYTQTNVISLMSGYAAFEPEHAELLQHVRGALRKPFRADELVQAVNACATAVA